MIEEMLAYNREFVRSRGYEKFQTSKYPDKKIAILTCMDTRLVELLPAALGIRNGDVKLIKNAGGMITGPFDSAVRSLLVAIVELGVEEVMVIGHDDCGVAHINADTMIRHLIRRGISQDHIDMMRYCGVDFEAWLRGFDCVESSVAETVELLRNHPLMPADVTIRGNGAAMRCSPAGMIASSLEEAEDLGQRTAEVTHKGELTDSVTLDTALRFYRNQRKSGCRWCSHHPRASG